MKNYFETNPDKNVLVAVVNKTGNTRALSQAMIYVKTSLDNKAVMLLSVDNGTKKVTHQCAVGKVCLIL